MRNVLIMHSADGIAGTRVMLFPSAWTFADANEKYKAALIASQVGDEWGWEDIEAHMKAAGFIETNWHVAPYAWDENAGYVDMMEGRGETL